MYLMPTKQRDRDAMAVRGALLLIGCSLLHKVGVGAGFSLLGKGSMRGYRFGAFQVDTKSGELRRSGIRVRLQDQPFQVLVAMLERPGELVSREELHKRLWPTDTFVDFENSLNSAVNRLRDALGDAADNPQYVETLPRRGYRFIAPVEALEAAPAAAAQPQVHAPPPVSPARIEGSAPKSSSHFVWIGMALALVAVALAGFLVLRRGSAIPAGKTMLAILPFDDLTGSSDHQYFVEGLTDELILRLGKLRPERLGVIARTSILQYKGTRKPIEQIGRELGVQYVLTGTIRQGHSPAQAASPAMLISTQLVQVSDQSSLWNESYEHSVQDFLEVQTDVAVRVTKSLATELIPDLQNALSKAQEINPDAQAAYLKGRYFWNRRSQAGAEGAINAAKYFEEATQLDSKFAAAHAALAAAQLSLATGGIRSMEEILPLARGANARALALDPNLADAYVNLARISMYYDRDWAGAERLFQKAISLDPSLSDGRFYYALLLLAQKKIPEGTTQLDLSIQSDPMGPSAWVIKSLLAERLGDVEGAMAAARKNAELLGNPILANLASGQALAWVGRCGEAMDLLRQADQITPRPAILDQYIMEIAVIHDRCGDKKAAQAAFAEAQKDPTIHALHRSLLEASMGHTSEACRQLERAVRERDPSLALLNLEVRFDPARKAPCFQKIMKAIGLPE